MAENARLGDLILYEVPRFFKAFVQGVGPCSPPPLRFRAMMILGALYKLGPKRPKELAVLFRLSKGNIKYHLDRLERMGYVKVERMSRKKCVVSLTEKGKRTLEEAYEAIKRGIERTLEKVPPDKLKDLEKALLTIKEINERFLEVGTR